ncbi:(2Fe-2S)-binding protein [Hankyongella ginsenosidimutans]|uniref:(2Fe-2S)-binding protein n=1 Tax=Hankyongella ginsenosidimutans TaxID=1763828 RepID=A0A4D7CBB4_9SPHN|nr:(2Fe-2S)-binding protein [Hankyongella ginsenosidimutans]
MRRPLAGSRLAGRATARQYRLRPRGAGRPARPAAAGLRRNCLRLLRRGVKTILTAITEQHLTSVEAIGTALKAGTNCGSCRSAIRALLPEERRVAHG